MSASTLSASAPSTSVLSGRTGRAAIPGLDYPISDQRLANGLRLLVNTDFAAPGVAVNLWYHVGASDEEPGATGFAHLFEHLMFAGSAQVASGQHLAAIEALGGSVNATTTQDRTNYFETVPLNALATALWLEADRLASLRVDQANLDTQREVVKEEKRQRYDNVPYGDVVELLLALNFGADHPYGHPTIGSMADLERASLEQVQDFFARWYQPGNAVLTLSGPIAPDDAFTLVSRYFDDIPGVPVQPHPGLSALPEQFGVPTLQVQRDVPADAVYLGWRTPPATDPRSYALAKALLVLSGGQSSRLNRRLVRDAEIAEAAGGFDFGLARGNSLTVLTARARSGHSLGEVTDALLDAVSDLASNGPSEAELARADAAFDREWLSELAAIDDRADQISGAATLLNEPERINHELELMHAVDAEQIAQAARTWLDPQAMTILDYTKKA